MIGTEGDFDPEEIYSIAGILKYVNIENEEEFVEALTRISGEYGKLDLVGVETIIRDQQHIPITLIARPISELPGAYSVLPHSDEMRYPFYLTYVTTDSTDALHILYSMGVSLKQNRENLKNTGLAASDLGSDPNDTRRNFQRRVNARWN